VVNNTPLVSVIVTTYNRKKLLKETIDSILNQSYKNFELIIVDNYSNYDFLSHINTFSDDRINAYQNANDSIIAVNRNYGIKKAKGEYIAFCDDDDLWMENKLEEQLKYFEDENIIGVGSSLILIGDTKLYKNKIYKSNRLLKFNNIIKEIVPLSSLIVRNLGYLFSEDKSLDCVEDFDFQISIILKSNKGILKVKEPLIFYRVILHSFAYINKANNGINIINKYRKYLSMWQYKFMLCSYYTNLGTRYLRMFQKKRALHFFLKGFQYGFPVTNYKQLLGIFMLLFPKKTLIYILTRHYK